MTLLPSASAVLLLLFADSCVVTTPAADAHGGTLSLNDRKPPEFLFFKARTMKSHELMRRPRRFCHRKVAIEAIGIGLIVKGHS
jgi:hypothetical protein